MACPWNFVISRETTGDSKVMWTYSHGFKVPVELLGDLVREFAAIYRDTVLRPT